MSIRPYVLDASVAVKWFFPTEENHENALEALDLISENANQYIVPDLFFLELSAVILRKSLFDQKFTKDALKRVIDLEIITIPVDNKLLLVAISLSAKYSIALYDSIYLTIAREVNGSWLTADKKAVSKLPAKDFLLLTNF